MLIGMETWEEGGKRWELGLILCVDLAAVTLKGTTVTVLLAWLE